jgi:hypothetical protein
VPEQTKFERFLEPVYLNEKMALNCAAYLFKGVPLESQQSDTADQRHGASASLAIPFLSELLGIPKIEGGYRSGSVQENRSAHRYTAGGLHMAVLDELNRRKMIQEFSADSLKTSAGIGETYVDIHSVLRPSDYYALIGTLKILGPLVAQVLRDFGERILAGKVDNFDFDNLKDSVNAYEISVMSLIDKLERDYLTSNQLEMILWSKNGNGRPVGIVDIDVTDHEPNELRAKLSGGKYHVIGKVVGRVEAGSSFDLLQKTILSNSTELIKKMMSFRSDEESLARFRKQSASIRKMVEQFVPLEIPGPAIRVAAMSVCI